MKIGGEWMKFGFGNFRDLSNSKAHGEIKVKTHIKEGYMDGNNLEIMNGATTTFNHKNINQLKPSIKRINHHIEFHGLQIDQNLHHISHRDCNNI